MGKAVKPGTWLAVALGFLAVVLYHVWVDRHQGYIHVFVDAYYHLAYLLSAANPTSFAQDPLLGDPSVARRAFIAYPGYYFLLGLGVRLLGFFNTLSLFQLILGLVYLFGMQILLLRLTGRPWVSAWMAVISAVRMPVFPGEQWGVLSIGTVMPGTLFLAVSPLFFWAWLRFQGQARARWLLFFLMGLMGTMHPLSWVIVVFSMLLGQLIQARFQRNALKEAAICGFLSTIPMVPFLVAWGGMLQQAQPVSPAEQARALEILTAVFLPVRLSFWWEHGQDALMNLAWVALALWAGWKIGPRIPRLVLYFAAGPVLLFLAAYALNELVLIPNGTVFIDGFRALKYLMLPATVIIALWLGQYQGKALAWRTVLTWLLLIVLNVPLLWQDIRQAPLALYRHVLHQWAAFVRPEPSQAQRQQRDVQQAAIWMRQHLPPGPTLVHVSHPDLLVPAKVRALAERSITHTLLDGGPLYLYNREKLIGWWQLTGTLARVRQQAGAYCSTAEVQVVRTLQATHLLCPGPTAQPNLKKVYESGSILVYALD